MFASDSDRAPYNVDPVNFGPRVGLAYRTLGNVVIRTGYGVFFDPIKGAAAGTGNGGFTGFNWNTPLLTTFNNDAATPYSRISDPYPSGVQLPPGSSQGFADAGGTRRKRADQDVEQHALHADVEFRAAA